MTDNNHCLYSLEDRMGDWHSCKDVILLKYRSYHYHMASEKCLGNLCTHIVTLFVLP